MVSMVHRIVLSAVITLASVTDAMSVNPVRDVSGAIAFIDNSVPDAVTGIWEFTEDGVVVLIAPSPNSDGRALYSYDITLLHTPSLDIRQGERVGALKPTADADKFVIEVCSELKDGRMFRSRQGAAILDKDGTGLSVRFPQKKYLFNPLGVLPHFWRLVRMRNSDPMADLPRGLVKIYPEGVNGRRGQKFVF